ncbi:hypothetical protein GCM10022214_68210 [Actinomadura miaoliensis]|uniref:Uncharacterized protein n=1 Tax=Actinomadura miaoliensis TaxID=430685 RepID=A0ABP7WRZ9_9ACTN
MSASEPLGQRPPDYLLGVLRDGAARFVYRGTVRALLGAPAGAPVVPSPGLAVGWFPQPGTPRAVDTGMPVFADALERWPRPAADGAPRPFADVAAPPDVQRVPSAADEESSGDVPAAAALGRPGGTGAEPVPRGEAGNDKATDDGPGRGRDLPSSPGADRPPVTRRVEPVELRVPGVSRRGPADRGVERVSGPDSRGPEPHRMAGPPEPGPAAVAEVRLVPMAAPAPGSAAAPAGFRAEPGPGVGAGPSRAAVESRGTVVAVPVRSATAVAEAALGREVLRRPDAAFSEPAGAMPPPSAPHRVDGAAPVRASSRPASVDAPRSSTAATTRPAPVPSASAPNATPLEAAAPAPPVDAAAPVWPDAGDRPRAAYWERRLGHLRTRVRRWR